MAIEPTRRELRPPAVYLWVLSLGGAGFAAGFFGPLIFAPEANQGPLVGILITGPGGAVLGLLLFVVCRLLHLPARRQWSILSITSAALVLTTLYFVMPGPQLRGYLVETEIQTCERPSEAADAAIQDWEKRVAKVTWAVPRAGWKEDARARLQTDPGVVLDVLVVRKNGIYEHRKPWDRGLITVKGWQLEGSQKSYYTRYAGDSCADYPAGKKSVQFTAYDLSGLTRGAGDWPPREVPDFLDRATIQPVPEQYRKFVGE